MKQKLIDILEQFRFPVYLQGTLNPDEAYPDHFFTFWTDYTADNAHYDNGVHSVDWNFTVNFYSVRPALVQSVPQSMRDVLRHNGFIPQGKGQDIPSDEPTHTGWSIDYVITEYTTD